MNTPPEIKYLGLADISFSSMGANLVVIADNEAAAKAQLLVAYNALRRKSGSLPLFATFEELGDWCGAAVRPITTGRAIIWEQIS